MQRTTVGLSAIAFASLLTLAACGSDKNTVTPQAPTPVTAMQDKTATTAHAMTDTTAHAMTDTTAHAMTDTTAKK